MKDTACLKQEHTQSRKLDDASQAVNVKAHSFDAVPILMSYNYGQTSYFCFFVLPITVKVTASVVNLACAYKSSLHMCIYVNKDTMTSPSNFPLFRPVAKIRHKKGLTAHPKDTEELFVLRLVLLHAIFNLEQKRRELLLLS